MIPNGFQWNEAELKQGDPLNAGLLSLFVIGADLMPVLIGTAFIIAAEGLRATAVSAAHCFEEVRKILHPNARHHLSALPEFLPIPKAVNLFRVKGLYMKGDQVHCCPIELALWDRETDLAVLTVSAPVIDPDFFRDIFWLDDQIPGVGEEIAMIGFGDMNVGPCPDPRHQFKMERRLVGRIGRVTEVYPEGYCLLKAPCIETSIPVFSGMSGGLVARYVHGAQIQPFAFISHAPEPQPLYNRAESGRSIAAILRMEKTKVAAGKQDIRFKIDNAGVGRQ